MTERTGMTGLKKGLHRIEVRCFSATGAMGLNVRRSGPKSSKGVIPAGVLQHAP
ncbi:MAG TPA: hypothetical protein PKH24_10260 [Sedimentisphaerales bacterium]|nr:hypothetical protein [Sedimentisphaerales bacterium]HNU29511.1 hypothetical protein [Sedimentisphaerales bacterium]